MHQLSKCKLIQMLKRSLNLRDCLSHFDFKKNDTTDVSIFPFIAILSVSHPQVPTVDQLERDSFRLAKKMISQMSLYLPLTAIS